jgi:tetratricopeptide (TPR) repeat protein
MEFQDTTREATLGFLWPTGAFNPTSPSQLPRPPQRELFNLPFLLAWEFSKRAFSTNLQYFISQVQLHVPGEYGEYGVRSLRSQHHRPGASYGSYEVSCWYNEGSYFETKYGTSYAMEDLDTAINYILLACIFTPDDHLFRPRRLTSLAACYGHRFERVRVKEDLSKALYLSWKAVQSCCQNNADFPTYANNLGSFFALSYQHLNDMLDLEKAILWISRAIDVALDYGTNPADSYSNLGIMLGWRYRRTGSVSDLSAALKLSELAVSTPYNQPSRATSKSNLADLLALDSAETFDPDSFTASLIYYREVWNDEAAPPIVRLKAAQKACGHLNALKQWHESSEILQGAVKLLSSISSRFLSRKDQQYLLRECASLGTTAASVILQAGGSVLHALRVLEIGRGVIASLSIESKGEDQDTVGVSAPKYQNYGCGFRETRIERRLNKMEGDSIMASDVRVGIQTALEEGSTGHFYHKDDTAFEQHLRHAACDGPLIVINESPVRCDAMLVEEDGISHVPLPDLCSEDITAYSKELKKIRTLRQRNNTNCTMAKQLEILNWLWTAAARPALDGLRSLGEAVEAGWPRVWWILTGRLSQLPIHASQCDSHFSESVMARVISSYCPSIRALIQSRQAQNSYNRVLKHVTISMDKTPDLPDLASAREEVKYVANPAARESFNLERPAKKDVIDKLTGAHVFHFAGHGKSNASDPFSSCLVLRDWQQDPLTVEDLLKTERKPANQFLAYLSACGTGLNQAEDLLDESINLMSAFQIVGFRHVIGALWEVEDRSAVRMAKDFYAELRNHKRVTDYIVAWSLHQAAIKFRNRSFGNPNANLLGWVPYIHFGP